ncbi:hypothetical protein BH20ACT9_BH20ACT9_12300 [soil metagenome]
MAGGCGPSELQTVATGRPVDIVVVAGGEAPGSFWRELEQGVDRAAARYRATVRFTRAGGSAAMARLIDDAVSDKPDGLAVAIPDPGTLEGPVKAAVKAGVPVISFNSGGDVASDWGVLTHVGQAGYQPYLQGYLPVEFLAQNARIGVHPVGTVETGPTS